MGCEPKALVSLLLMLGIGEYCSGRSTMTLLSQISDSLVLLCGMVVLENVSGWFNVVVFPVTMTIVERHFLSWWLLGCFCGG